MKAEADEKKRLEEEEKKRLEVEERARLQQEEARLAAKVAQEEAEAFQKEKDDRLAEEQRLAEEAQK